MRVVVAALAVALIACLPGIAHLRVTPDGVYYAAIAQNLLAGNGYATGLDQPAVTWMPGYPLVLTVATALFHNVADSANAVNFLAVAAIFVLSWLLLVEWRGSKDWLTWLGAAITAASPVMLSCTGSALSEPLFAAFAMLLLYAATKAEGSRRHWWLMVGAALAVALTRHTGTLLLVAVALMWRKRSYWLALAPGAVAAVAWLTLAGTGAQEPRVFSVVRGLDGLLRSFYGLAEQVGGWPMVGLLLVMAWPWRKSSDNEGRATWASVLFMLTTALSGFILTAGDMESRMQLGAFVPLMLCLVSTVLWCDDDHVRYGLTAGLAVASFIAVIGGVLDTSTMPVDFNRQTWRKSQAVAVIAQLAESCDIYTNAQDGVWLATGAKTYQLPRTDGKHFSKPPQDRGGLLVWFDIGRTYYVTPQHYGGRIVRQGRVGDATMMVVK